MAWTWRKRKSIIPGVRLNFGRKGISTTIGPRGASMTFGPNGTYFNTSIPGTGLYNRQRIGGKGSTTMNNNVTGCKGYFMAFLALTMWCLVILTALMGLAVSPWLALAMFVIIIATHFIVATVAQKKQANEVQSTRPVTTQIPTVAVTGGNPADTYKITDEYFSQIAKSADDLFADYEKVVNLPNIDSLVSSMGVQFVMNGAPMTNIKDKVRLLFWVDITRCYLGLGHLIDFSSKEGLGLFYFIARTKGCLKQKSYTTFDTISSVYKRDAESILKGIKAYVEAAPTPSEIFLVARLLASNDTSLHRKFLVDIYRFASLTAKADNTVTEEEAEWLGSIMKLQGGSTREIVPDEDEQDSHSISSLDLSQLDPLFADVARWVVARQEGNTAKIQQQFELGFKRVGTIMDQLETVGVVGPNKGPKGRDVLIQDPNQLDKLLAQVKPSSTPKKQPSATSAMKELKSLIGLESVKKEVETLSNFIKIQQTREAKGLKTSSVSYHCVFTGNPGTGKTTVARILAKIYKKLGVVSKGHLVETDRAGLVAEYVGQTAVKTNKIIDSALDGVLFIDEAYSLVSKSESDYGKEAIATLLKRMEDDRNRLIVILAGYTNEMKEFIDTNPGLQSRFNRYIEFPDYNEDELLQIFMRSVEQYEYTMSDEAVEGLKNYLKEQVANKDKNFGNGRLVRNIFEKTLERQANRLAHEVNLTTEKLSRIEIEDLPLK